MNLWGQTGYMILLAAHTVEPLRNGTSHSSFIERLFSLQRLKCILVYNKEGTSNCVLYGEVFAIEVLL